MSFLQYDWNLSRSNLIEASINSAKIQTSSEVAYRRDAGAIHGIWSKISEPSINRRFKVKIRKTHGLIEYKSKISDREETTEWQAFTKTQFKVGLFDNNWELLAK